MVLPSMELLKSQRPFGSLPVLSKAIEGVFVLAVKVITCSRLRCHGKSDASSSSSEISRGAELSGSGDDWALSLRVAKAKAITVIL